MEEMMNSLIDLAKSDLSDDEVVAEFVKRFCEFSSVNNVLLAVMIAKRWEVSEGRQRRLSVHIAKATVASMAVAWDLMADKSQEITEAHEAVAKTLAKAVEDVLVNVVVGDQRSDSDILAQVRQDVDKALSQLQN